MALKKVLLPTTAITLPLSKKELMVRPYTVGEQKTLLLTSKDNPQAITNSIFNLIKVCSETPIELTELKLLPYQDVMFLYSFMSASSSGSERRLLLPCSNCDAKEEPVKINLSKSTLDKTEVDYNVKLSETLVVKMKLMNLEIALKSIAAAKDTNTEVNDVIGVIAESIDTIVDGDNVSIAADYALKDIVEWVETLPENMFVQLVNWVKSAPAFKNDVTFVCRTCGHVNHMEIKDVENFFG